MLSCDVFDAIKVNRIVNKTDFEQLFRQYYPILCRIAYGYVREHTIVEEVVNDVFMKYWNNRFNILIHKSLKDYLFKTTQNICIDYLRSNQKRRQRTSYIDEQEVVCTTLYDLGENPLDYIINHETGKRIMEAIEELPERYRLTFKLSRIDELNYDEIANIMSISKNTVKSNLRDALAILRKKLKDLIIAMLLFFIFCFLIFNPSFFQQFTSYLI